MENWLIVILGPTASGKTAIGIDIAEKLGACIVSADSRQIYKELSVGTAVPDKQQLQRVQHFLIQEKSIQDYYNASMFEFEVLDLLNNLFVKNHQQLMVGGSGLYVNAVCSGIDDLPTIDAELRFNLMERLKNEGIESLRMELRKLDPAYYAVADLRNPKRILKALEVSMMTGRPYSTLLTHGKKSRGFNILKIGLNLDRSELHDRINTRVDDMMNRGLLEEVKGVFPSRQLNALNTVGYRELFDHLEGKTTFEEAVELIKRNTRRYARKQISFFSRDKDVKWFHPLELEEILNYIYDQTKTR